MGAIVEVVESLTLRHGIVAFLGVEPDAAWSVDDLVFPSGAVFRFGSGMMDT